jgi:phasin family protein
MSNPKFEQMFVAQKASSEVLVALMRTSFEGMQRLAELNMAAAKQVMSTTAANVNTLASAKDLSDVSRLGPQMAKPEQLMDYWRNVYDLVTGMQKDVTAVMQSNYSQLAKNAASAIEQKKASALDGGDMMANAVKDMIETSNKAFENMQTMTSQMASIAGASLKAASGTSKPSGKK